MSLYCLKCKKKIESKRPQAIRTKIGKIICDSKKSKFIREQEAIGLLSS